MSPNTATATPLDGRELLLAALGRVLAEQAKAGALGVAVSGGPDSFALAALAAQLAREQGRTLHLLHVHHGLQAMADSWAGQVQALALALQATCHIRRVTVALGQGDGVEAAARLARYAALNEMAAAAGVSHILLAHHLDDQAETVLLRLLRGAGPEGMGAMTVRVEREGIDYLRPWLDIERARILPVARELAAELGLELVNDPSNLDARHARGVLRKLVLPAIASHWPGYRATLSRFARLSSHAASVLAEVAEGDLREIVRQHPAYGDTIELPLWKQLSPARRALAVRAWLARQNVAMPSEARLAQMCQQLLRAAPDRQVLLQHAGLRLRVYRNRIMLDRLRGKTRVVPASTDAAPPSVTVSWQGEASLYLPELAGTLHFDRVGQGIDAQWLQSQPLRIGLRRGRERLRPASQGPSRSLKNLYQEAGIPPWERARLPLVWRGGTLLFAAGLQHDARAPRAAEGVMLRWEADSPGATITLPACKLPPNTG